MENVCLVFKNDYITMESIDLGDFGSVCRLINADYVDFINFRNPDVSLDELHFIVDDCGCFKSDLNVMASVVANRSVYGDCILYASSGDELINLNADVFFNVTHLVSGYMNWKNMDYPESSL